MNSESAPSTRSRGSTRRRTRTNPHHSEQAKHHDDARSRDPQRKIEERFKHSSSPTSSRSGVSFLSSFSNANHSAPESDSKCQFQNFASVRFDCASSSSLLVCDSLMQELPVANARPGLLTHSRAVRLRAWFRECDRHDNRLALRRDPVSEFTKVGDLENRQRLRIDRDHSVYLRPDAVITMLAEEVWESRWQTYRRSPSIACNSRHLRCTDLSRTCDQPLPRVTSTFPAFRFVPLMCD